MPGLNTTLVEGKTPAHIAEAIKSAAPPPFSAPPVSAERPISHLEPPQEPAPEPKSKGLVFIVLGVVLIAILVVVFILLRHH